MHLNLSVLHPPRTETDTWLQIGTTLRGGELIFFVELFWRLLNYRCNYVLRFADWTVFGDFVYGQWFCSCRAKGKFVRTHVCFTFGRAATEAAAAISDEPVAWWPNPEKPTNSYLRSFCFRRCERFWPGLENNAQIWQICIHFSKVCSNEFIVVSSFGWERRNAGVDCCCRMKRIERRGKDFTTCRCTWKSRLVDRQNGSIAGRIRRIMDLHGKLSFRMLSKRVALMNLCYSWPFRCATQDHLTRVLE